MYTERKRENNNPLKKIKKLSLNPLTNNTKYGIINTTKERKRVERIRKGKNQRQVRASKS